MIKHFSKFQHNKENNKKVSQKMTEHSTRDENVDLFGKVAHFPKNVKASNAYNFLENVKINRNKIWYILIEKQDNELQMLKYNIKAGVNLTHFITELKQYYVEKYSDQPNLKTLIENLRVGGEEKFVVIRNIPKINLAGKPLITRLTEDLIKLLSK